MEARDKASLMLCSDSTTSTNMETISRVINTLVTVGTFCSLLYGNENGYFGRNVECFPVMFVNKTSYLNPK